MADDWVAKELKEAIAKDEVLDCDDCPKLKKLDEYYQKALKSGIASSAIVTASAMKSGEKLVLENSMLRDENKYLKDVCHNAVNDLKEDLSGIVMKNIASGDKLYGKDSSKEKSAYITGLKFILMELTCCTVCGRLLKHPIDKKTGKEDKYSYTCDCNPGYIIATLGKDVTLSHLTGGDRVDRDASVMATTSRELVSHKVLQSHQSQSSDQVCKHCFGDLSIRNPTGKCDHLHYPENCTYCKLLVSYTLCDNCKQKTENIQSCKSSVYVCGNCGVAKTCYCSDYNPKCSICIAEEKRIDMLLSHCEMKADKARNTSSVEAATTGPLYVHNTSHNEIIDSDKVENYRHR